MSIATMPIGGPATAPAAGGMPDPMMSAPAPAPAPAPADEFPPLDTLPAIAAVIQGEPPALMATVNDKDSPTMAAVLTMSDQIPKIGLAFFANKDTAVLFNPKLISAADVAKKVKDGSIKGVAVPVSQFEDAVNRTLDEGGVPESPGSTAGVPPAPAGTAKKINSARLTNLTDNSPTSGPAPGQGLVNDLKKRAI